MVHIKILARFPNFIMQQDIAESLARNNRDLVPTKDCTRSVDSVRLVVTNTVVAGPWRIDLAISAALLFTTFEAMRA